MIDGVPALPHEFDTAASTLLRGRHRSRGAFLAAPYPLRKFVQFAALAGCGWLLDFCLLLALVRVAGAAPSVANVVSSMTAAASVFLVSRIYVFGGASGSVHLRLGAYLVYTLAVILAASAVVGLLVARFASPAGLFGARIAGATAAAAAAKVLVTPPQLILNFFVSRFLSTTRPALGLEANG